MAYTDEIYRRQKRQVPVGEILRAVGAGIQGRGSEYKPATPQIDDLEKLIIGSQIKESLKPTSEEKLTEFEQRERLKSDIQTEALQKALGEGATAGGFKPKGVNIGGVSYERIPSEEETNQEINEKVKERAAIDAELAKQKGLPAETAGKLVMVQQASKDIDDARNLLFPGGTPESFNRKAAFVSNVPGSRAPIIGALIPQALPFNETGQKIYSKLQNAVAAKLRIETGAQANPSEVENILRRFGVTSFSDANAAWDSLQRLQDFMTNTTAVIDPMGNFKYVPSGAQTMSQLPTQQNEPNIPKYDPNTQKLQRNKTTGEIRVVPK